LFIDNLLVRLLFIIETIWWTGLAPWNFEFPFPDGLTSTFLARADMLYGRRKAFDLMHDLFRFDFA